jgi:hypothetical protein
VPAIFNARSRSCWDAFSTAEPVTIPARLAKVPME